MTAAQHTPTQRPTSPTCCGDVGCAHDPRGVPTVPALRDRAAEYRALRAREAVLCDELERLHRALAALVVEMTDEELDAGRRGG